MQELKKLRTIEQAYAALKEMDPDTAISKWFIREAILNGEIPFVQVHSKRLIDLGDLINYINKSMCTMAERQARQ
ncbi:DNA-binding protein [Senimuribacter intestinalis]|uniref:DNA-binding protein n=1 Tax=Senimuribacter intestinalis TaxID=2941507 RepID=UPI00203FE536|nr:DNA-binding protein [Senimuribacter intestinalis]